MVAKCMTVIVLLMSGIVLSAWIRGGGGGVAPTNCILISGTSSNCLLISGTTTNALLVK